MSAPAQVGAGDVVRTPGGDLWVVVRGAPRALAVRAYAAPAQEPGAAPAGSPPPLPASSPATAAAPTVPVELVPGNDIGSSIDVALDEQAPLAALGARVVGRLTTPALTAVLRARVLGAADAFSAHAHAPRAFVGGESEVPYAGRVFDGREVRAAVDASLDFWLTLGPHGKRFEKALARFLGVRYSILVNSGSSANLCAFAALTSSKLGDRALRPGDEVITAAAGFPTTVNPILQHGCVPVFVDSDPSTGNLDARALDQAMSPRVRCVMLAHALGNPFDVDAVQAFCKRHGLWLVEDNCDALGSTYRGKPTGGFGDLSTQSFYPPHHLTMGEGGAVNVVREGPLKTIVESFRDWGRDCWCEPGDANTCGKRFAWQLGELPEGYDHKYIYSHIGYNLKPLDIQAAIGEQQMRRLPDFTAARRRNWQTLRDGVADLEEFFELPMATPGSEPSWFGFLLLVRASSPFRRTDVVRFLADRKIQTRNLFAGNLTRQPAYHELRVRGEQAGGRPPFRVVGDLGGADRLMNEAFFVGVYPGLSGAQIDWIIASLHDFVRQTPRA